MCEVCVLSRFESGDRSWRAFLWAIGPSGMSVPDIATVSSAAWQEARRCLPVIRRLADDLTRTRADVEAGARELGRSPTDVYALMQRYLADPRLTSLLPRKRGPGAGFSRLLADVDALIEKAIDDVYLTPQKPEIMDLVRHIRRQCAARGLPTPSRRAVTARMRARPKREAVAKREGAKAARDRYAPVVGSLEANWPLSLIQIDHTLVDVIVVDTATRAPIQRPWLTLAIDVCTRCVAGFHLSLEPPSATSVALCLSHAPYWRPWMVVPPTARFARIHVLAKIDAVVLRSCDRLRIAVSSAAEGASLRARLARSCSASRRACSVRAFSQSRSSVRATSRFSGSTAAYCRRARSTS